MKIIILLFSFYMLALPAIAQRVDACAETEVCAEDKCLADDCSNEEKDDCDTYCACSCCVHVVSVNVQSPVTAIEKTPVKNNLLGFYDNISLPSNYFGNIWQPPKLG